MSRIAFIFATLLALAGAPFAADNHGDWIKPGEFKGKKIYIACYYWEGAPPSAVPLNHVPQVLREMGFTVEIGSPPHLPDLARYDQLWIVSGTSSTYDQTDIAKLRAFLKAGKGLYVLADNTPYIAEANTIGAALHGLHFDGGYYGGQMINVVSAGTVKKLVDEAMKKGDLGKLAEL